MTTLQKANNSTPGALWGGWHLSSCLCLLYIKKWGGRTGLSFMLLPSLLQACGTDLNTSKTKGDIKEYTLHVFLSHWRILCNAEAPVWLKICSPVAQYRKNYLSCNGHEITSRFTNYLISGLICTVDTEIPSSSTSSDNKLFKAIFKRIQGSFPSW